MKTDVTITAVTIPNLGMTIWKVEAIPTIIIRTLITPDFLAFVAFDAAFVIRQAIATKIP